MKARAMVSCGLAVCLWLGGGGSRAADQPQWGQAWSRNPVSPETGLPVITNAADGLRWSADLGTETHATPIIANGRVYIGTNNGKPRDPKHQGDRGVLLCLDEKTGRLLWQLVVPKREEDIYFDWPQSGICSPVTVEGDRVYLVSNRGEVLCLDARGLANGNDGPFQDEARHMTRVPPGADPAPEPLALGATDADILWLFDLTAGAGIWSHDGAHSSILIRGDFLYLNTGTGVDNTHRKIRTPDAPSLVVLEKSSGRLVARDDLGIAPNIFHCTWSSPSLATVNGRDQILFAAGNGVVYAFEPLDRAPGQPVRLPPLWQFDFDPAAPKTNVHQFVANRKESPSNFYGLPVFADGNIFVAGGGDIWWGKKEAWLKCLRPGPAGDITTNGLVWSYPLQRHVLGTPAVHDGLVYLADIGRRFHCVDAASGKPVWTHEIRGDAWASPYVADGKVYLGTRTGMFYTFATGREKRLLGETTFDKPISATATAANGVLYVATMNRLHAFAPAAR